MDSEPELYFNPSCSKCQTALSLLEDSGVDATLVRYLEQVRTVDQLQVLMEQLGIDDPREMMRTGEDLYSQLGLADAPPERLLELLA